MTSWRAQLSPHSLADVDGILDIAFDLAQEELGKRGEFLPFVLTIGTEDDHVSLSMVLPNDHDDQPAAEDVVTACLLDLQMQRGELRTAAVVSSVYIPELNTDAIDVRVEHVEGLALDVLCPYSKRRLRGSFSFGDLRAQAATRQIWPTTS